MKNKKRIKFKLEFASNTYDKVKRLFCITVYERDRHYAFSIVFTNYSHLKNIYVVYLGCGTYYVAPYV
jgi:hypothetical protein